MKRILVLTLALLMMLSFFGATGTAANTTKISNDLWQKLQKMADDDTISVELWAHYTINEAEVKRQTVAETGYSLDRWGYNYTQEEVDLYRSTYNRIITEIETAAINQVVKILRISDDDIIQRSKHGYAIVKLTKTKIMEANDYDSVASIGLYENEDDISIEEPSVQHGIVDANPSDTFKKRISHDYPFIEDYRELCYCYDDNGSLEWVLFEGYEASVLSEGFYCIIGNRVIVNDYETAPFGTGYGIYDSRNDTISAVYNGMLSNYDGLEQAFNQYGGGKLLGDLDYDNALTVVDTTILQRCEAMMQSYPDSDVIDPCGMIDGDLYSPLTYYSDFNRDGERNILDATCIQRCLAGLIYPVG